MNTLSDLCHQQALLARAICAPNPAVGAVIVDANGLIIGTGHTQIRGGPHAEIMALRNAQSNGHPVNGACMYVSLEPCAHHGRTGPCVEAIINAGIRKVVAPLTDPNPQVAGKGFARLRAAGIEVEIGPGAEQSRELNIGFFSRMTRRTPWVRMKIAASLDGKTALTNGASQWITSDLARIDGHRWRARACVILTGVGTVMADNPRLDVRLVDSPRQPDVAVVDSRLATPPDSQIFAANRTCFIFSSLKDVQREAALAAVGAKIIQCQSRQSEISSRVDLKAMLNELARMEINEVHVEAGHTLNGALLHAGLVDEVVIYLAPKLIGTGVGMADWEPLTNLSQAVELDIQSFEPVGKDIRVLARVANRPSL